MHKITNVNIENQTGECSICGPTKIKVRNRFKKNGAQVVECNSLVVLSRARELKIHLSPENVLAHGNTKKCECCGLPREIVIDHCHKTGTFRGFICRYCNLGLGAFHDSTEKLQSAITYLNKKRNPPKRVS